MSGRHSELLVRLAGALARTAGLATFRFDHSGNGDSEGRFRWLEAGGAGGRVGRWRAGGGGQGTHSHALRLAHRLLVTLTTVAPAAHHPRRRPCSVSPPSPPPPACACWGTGRYGHYRAEAEEVRAAKQHLEAAEGVAVAGLVGHSKGGTTAIMYAGKVGVCALNGDEQARRGGEQGGTSRAVRGAS